MKNIRVINKIKKSVFAFVLSIVAVMSSFIPSFNINASALKIPKLSNGKYIQMYAASDGTIPVYTNSSLRTRGSSSTKYGWAKNYNAYIDGRNDMIYVYELCASYAYVKYPAGSTYRYGYINPYYLSGFSESVACYFYAKASVKTYTKPNRYNQFGWIDSGDRIFVVAAKNGGYQTIYPVGNNYKMGWISSYDYNRIKGNNNTNSSSNSSSNLRNKMVNKALGEVGTAEVGINNVKYNTWYYGRTINASGFPWCDVFVSWCANQSGISTNVIPKSSGCANTLSFFKRQGRFYYSRYRGGNYTPKAGDLVFYGSNGTCHIGIITGSPVNGYLQVIEGNVYMNGKWKVVKFTSNDKRKLTSSYVYGFASPNY